MTTLEILKQARALISDPDRWCKHDVCDATGKRLCSVGAIKSVSGIDIRAEIWGKTSAGIAYDFLSKFTGDEFTGDIPYYNDTHTHAEVLALFDRAIASLEPPVLPPRNFAEEMKRMLQEGGVVV